MLHSAITIVFPLLYIFQKHFQSYQKYQSACMDANSLENAKSEIIHDENSLVTNSLDNLHLKEIPASSSSGSSQFLQSHPKDEGLNLLANIDEKEKNIPVAGPNACMYSRPALIHEEPRLFPPPISCLKLFDKGKPFVYYELNKENGRFSPKEMIIPGGSTMSCLRHNNHIKMWFPRIPRLEEEQLQPHQEGNNHEDDDDDDNSSSDDDDSDYYLDSSSEEEEEEDDDDYSFVDSSDEPNDDVGDGDNNDETNKEEEEDSRETMG